MTYALNVGTTTIGMYPTYSELLEELTRLDPPDFEIEIIEDAEPAVPTKMVKNILSGRMVEIPVDTPRCCDPSTELYHCM